MLVRALRRLLAAAGLAVLVSLILTLIFDSGLLGDPAVAAAGLRASPRSLNEARVRLGRFERFEPNVLLLRVDGPPQRFVLAAGAQRLYVRTLQGEERLELALAERDLASLTAALEGAPLGGAWTLHARLERHADPQAPAAGVATALTGVAVNLDAGREQELGWAQEVAFPRRFARQTLALCRGEFGRSSKGQPIGAELASRAARSLALAVPGFLLSTLLALALALLAAARRGRLDRALTVLSVAGMCAPAIAVVALAQYWLAARLQWFPIHGWEPPYWRHLLLPVLVWVLLYVWGGVRLYRALAVEELERGYVPAARAKGLSLAQTLRRHVLVNLAVPLLAQLVSALPYLALGSLLIERFFGIPGLGGYVVDAVRNGDQAVLRAVTFLAAVLCLAFQWLADLACRAADPRWSAAA